jgi:hypothetical protein
MEETVSRREVSVVRTDLRSSSRVVAGAAAASATAATGAEATGTAGAATGAAAGAAAVAADLRAAVFFTSAAGAAGAGAATGAGVATGASSVFLATRLGLAAEEVEAEFIILVPVEEFISIKRTIPSLVDALRINFYSKPFNFATRAHTWNFFSLNDSGG